MQLPSFLCLGSWTLIVKVVPLVLLDEVLNEDLPRSELKELVHSMAIPIDREVGRNDIIQHILEAKGPKFVVSRKSMTKRKGQTFNTYSRSRQDLCIQHVENAFKSDTVMSGVITSSDATLVEGTMEVSTSPTIEGDVITSKRVTFETDQVLAKMLWTLLNQLFFGVVKEWYGAQESYHLWVIY